jgi:hypothetical protein
MLAIGAILLAGSGSCFAQSVSISTISPAQGSTRATTEIELTGSGFTNSMSVWFGALQAPIVDYVNSNTVYVDAPAQAVGTVQIAAIVSPTDEFHSGYVFTYVTSTTPTITSVSPATGTADQATVVTLTGSNFQSGDTVRISGSYASAVTVVSSTQIRATLPGMSAGSYAVEVINSSGSVATLNNAFTYLALLNLLTTALPSATVDKAYSAALDASGGKTPYSWSVAGGALPSGIVMAATGVISGSGTTAGTSAFSAKVSDAAGQTAERSLTLTAEAGSTPGSTPSGSALSSCQAITTGGTYYLAGNVTCTSQGFALNASGITLNLNGHTITYGSPTAVVPAFSICDQWYSRLPRTSCGNGAHQSPEIYNGSIVQASNSIGFSHAIWIGQGNGINGGYIHDLTITIQATGTEAFYGDYPGVGWKIENNTINDNVTYIQQSGQSPLGARSQFQGMVINFDNSNAAGAGNIFTSNTINGSPQGGIRDSTQNSQITNNVIKLSSEYSNDYGVIMLANGQTASGNVIAGRGRGIDAEASAFKIENNTITVHEEANNSEYSGCELDGTYGVRVKNYPMISGYVPSTGWTISGNTVSVSAQYCPAHALQLTDLPTTVAGTISNNSFTTTNRTTISTAGIDQDAGDYGVTFDGYDQAQVNFQTNTFNASVCAQISNDASTDGADATIQSGQHWSCGQYSIADIDLTGSGGGTYPQALTIDDTISGASGICGPYAEGTLKVGSWTEQCKP